MDQHAVEVTVRDGVTWVVLRRPHRRNALTSAMHGALADALLAAGVDEGVSAVVLTGSDGCFCSGNDLQDMAAGDAPGEALRFVDALVGLPVPLVAAVDGPAIGVGATLLLHCDLVAATRQSTFAMPFVDLGLIPEAGSTLLLPRRVGPGRATRLALLGEAIDAATALQWGLIDEVCDDEAALASRVAEVARSLADKPREALMAARALLRDPMGTTVERTRRDAEVMHQLMPGARMRLAERARSR